MDGEKVELLKYAEELVKLSEESIDRVKKYPHLYCNEDLNLREKGLELSKQFLENIKNS